VNFENKTQINRYDGEGLRYEMEENGKKELEKDKAVNRYNILYAMLRYQEAISIYHTFLFDSPISGIVKGRINCNSKYFEILDKKIRKKVSGVYNIGIYLTKYQRRGHKQYIHLVIYEADGYGKEGRNIILEESIEMKSWIYA